MRKTRPLRHRVATPPPGGLSELPPCAKPGPSAPGRRLPTTRRDSQRRHGPVAPQRWPPARLSSSATGLSAPPRSRHPAEMAASTPFLLCVGTLSPATVPSPCRDGRKLAFPPPRRDSQHHHGPVIPRRWPPARLSSSATGRSAPPRSRHGTKYWGVAGKV